MFVFTWLANFGTPFWDRLWAIWQNVCYGSALAWWCLYEKCKGEERLMVRPVAWYSLALCIWEFTALVTGWSIDSVGAVALFFGATACIIGYVALWRDTRFSLFLRKHLHL